MMTKHMYDSEAVMVIQHSVSSSKHTLATNECCEVCRLKSISLQNNIEFQNIRNTGRRFYFLAEDYQLPNSQNKLPPHAHKI